MFDETYQSDYDCRVEPLHSSAELIRGEFVIVRSSQIKILERGIWHGLDIVDLLDGIFIRSRKKAVNLKHGG